MRYVYDRPTGRYTTAIPDGTKGLRKHLIERFGFTRTEVVRDASRCRNKGSAHCECRAVDAFTIVTAFGNEVFDYCVANWERFELQAVVWQHRQWGFGKPYEHRRDKTDHFDHVHAEQTIAGSKAWDDGQEDDMTPEQDARLKKVEQEIADIKKALYIGQASGPPIELDNYVREQFKAVLAELKAIKEKP